jgi:peptidoglycan-associated lipoprotein
MKRVGAGRSRRRAHGTAVNGAMPRKEVAVMMRFKWLVLACAIALVLVPACAKKQVAPVEQPVEVAPPPVTTPIEQPPVVEEKPVEVVVTLEDVFFDFDKYSIGDAYKQVLTNDAQILMAHPEKSLIVEGHCDERGTNEYNMALGEKRAKAVVDFLTTYGVAASRITWISYGEEKPFSMGHDEAAWAQNRRAHFVIK